jgi:adenylyl cyclase-associated protein
MTHKNPSLRAGGVVSGSVGANSGRQGSSIIQNHSIEPPHFTTAGKKPQRPIKPPSLMAKKPSKFALEGTKWIIVSLVVSSVCTCIDSGLQEYQENERNLIVENAGMSQTISLFGCKNSTIVIKGKVNAVTIGIFVFC